MARRRSFSTKLVDPPGKRHAHQIHALVENGRCPFSDHVAGLKKKEREKVYEYLAERLAPLGSDGFNAKSQFENYRGGLYGLKPGSHRLLLTRVGAKVWIVVDAFSKADINKTSAQTQRMNAARETVAALRAQLERQRRK